MNVSEIAKVLASLYTPYGVERVGFIINTNTIAEVQNNSSDPENGFMVSPEDIERYTEEQVAAASWHTHPGGDANLSGEDFRMFKAYRTMKHFIVGKDGVRCFQYDEASRTILEVKIDE